MEGRGRLGDAGSKVSVCGKWRAYEVEVGRQAAELILTWQGRYHDHEGGFPRARLIHCTPDVLTPAISPNVGNSTA